MNDPGLGASPSGCQHPWQQCPWGARNQEKNRLTLSSPQSPGTKRSVQFCSIDSLPSRCVILHSARNALPKSHPILQITHKIQSLAAFMPMKLSSRQSKSPCSGRRGSLQEAPAPHCPGEQHVNSGLEGSKCRTPSHSASQSIASSGPLAPTRTWLSVLLGTTSCHNTLPSQTCADEKQQPQVTGEVNADRL